MEDTGYGKKIINKLDGHFVGGTLLQIDKGKRTDMIFHHHTEKMIYVLKGTITAWILTNGKVAPLGISAGNSFYIRAGLVHQFEALDHSLVIEYVSNINTYEEDVTVIGKGSILEEKPKAEDGENVKMTPEDEKANEEDKPKKKTSRKRTPKKTSKKAPAKKKTTRKSKK